MAPQTPQMSMPANQPRPHGAPGAAPPGPWLVAAISAALVMLILAVFGQTAGFQFVNFDDNEYVYDNPAISAGLSLKGVRWAFTHVHSGNWHPLTTIVHMLDCQLFGLWPGGHHLTNVILHAVCAVLLFLMLLEMTGAVWRSGFVAALFAIHPLRVESVAWVSELKDVLSGIFFMLTLWAYVRYARRQSRSGYAMVLLWFALGLLSKPMLVTLPFVLFLLDYWPLNRLENARQLPALFIEKLPLLALAALSCVVTIFAQRSEIQPIGHVPLSFRFGNALSAYVIYLGKLIWPSSLALPYPLRPDGAPPWQVLNAILILGALTAGVWIFRRRMPWLPVGWFWYLGMLVPVIGIMQVGYQAYADRYTYLPQIGLCVAIVWTAASWAQAHRFRTGLLAAAAPAILCALAVTAGRQTRVWRDGGTLWLHTLQCTSQNPVARGNLGSLLLQQGRLQEAIDQLRQSIQGNPGDPNTHYNLGLALLQSGDPAQAAGEFAEVCAILPTDAEAHRYLGDSLARQGRNAEAVPEFRLALRSQPADAETCYDFANSLLALGQSADAITAYRAALEINPSLAVAHGNLAVALTALGQTAGAIAEYQRAIQLNPAYVEAQYNLGNALAGTGDAAGALAHVEKAYDLQPSNLPIANSLAWMLATAPQSGLRDGPRALKLAIAASQASAGNNPVILRTLAAAYAQVGDFQSARRIAQRALDLAQSQSNPALAAALPREIDLYAAGQPFSPEPH